MKHTLKISSWMIALVLFVCTAAISQTHTSLNGPLQPREIKDITSSSNGDTLYAVDKTFLFKSVNGGTSWAKTGIELASPLAVVCKPDNADVVVAGIANELRRSEYGGSSGTWDLALQNAGTPLRLSVSPISGQTNYMFLGRAADGSNASIMRSTNGGFSWSAPTTYPSGTSINDIYPYEVSGSKNQHVWAGGSSGAGEGTNPNATASSRGVWKSTNLGADWTEKKMGDYNVTAVAVYDAQSLIYAGTASGKLYKSDNDGGGWSEVTNYRTQIGASAVRAVRVIQSSGDIYVASNLGIHLSTNNGTDWSLVKSDNFLSLTIPSGNQSIFYGGTSDTVHKSTNSGSTWSVINEGLGRMPISSSTGYASKVYTVSNDFSKSGYSDGSAWTMNEIGSSGTFRGVDIFRNSNGTLYTSGVELTNRARLYSSTDEGANWTLDIQSTSNGSAGDGFYGVVNRPGSSSVLYAFGYSYDNGIGSWRNLYKYNGSSWTVQLKVPNSSGKVIYSFAVDSTGQASDNEKLFASIPGMGLYRSVDNGTNWAQVFPNTSDTIWSVMLNPARPSIVYAGANSGIWRSSNSGASGSWIQIRSGYIKKLFVATSGAKAADEVVAIATGANGDTVLRSVFPDQSNRYTDITDNLPKPISGVGTRSANPRFYYFATDQGVYQSIDFVPTAPILAGLTTSTTPKHPLLNWHVGDADVKQYRVYRYRCDSEEGDCNGTGILIATSTDTTYTDNSIDVWAKGQPYPNYN